jgi:hypothetical protein
VPTNQLNYDPLDFSTNTFMLTRKERLRGVAGQVIASDFSNLKASNDINEMEGSEEVFLRELRQRYTEMEYQYRVLKSRIFTVVAQYSPYRICGLPGLYLDTGLPCVLGLIKNISTTISADGAATSQITFNFPRLIRPDSTSDFDKKVQQLGSDLDAWLKESGVFPDDLTDENRSEFLKKRWPFLPNQKVLFNNKEITLGSSYEGTDKAIRDQI